MRCACDPPLRIAPTTHRACLPCWFPHGSPTTRYPRATAARHLPHITSSWVEPMNARSRPTAPDADPPPSLPPPSLRRSLFSPPTPPNPGAELREARYPLSLQEPRAAGCPLDSGVEGGSLPPLDSGAEGGSLPPDRGILLRFWEAATPVFVARDRNPDPRGRPRLPLVAAPPPRLLYQVRTKYPLVLLGWPRAVSGERPSVPAA